MLYWIGILLLRVMRWQIRGKAPDLPKYVMILAPHTSNWDFVIAASAKYKLRLKARFLAKGSLFKPPFGWIFRTMGGYPVDRSQRTNLVDFAAGLFREHDSFSIALAPEGTRKRVNAWKTGFYHIARQANCPIIPVGLDYPSRQIVIGQAFTTSGDIGVDLPKLQAFFHEFTGKYPDQQIPKSNPDIR